MRQLKHDIPDAEYTRASLAQLILQLLQFQEEALGREVCAWKNKLQLQVQETCGVLLHGFMIDQFRDETMLTELVLLMDKG